MFIVCRSLLLASLGILLGGVVLAQEMETIAPEQVREAMRKSAEFYRQRVAVQGGYVYYYSLDLRQRWGEGPATAEQIWVQPPGTPTVGLAMLAAYRATGERYYLDAAREAAEALVYGQLRSGGWSNSIDMQRRRQGDRYSGGALRREGTSSLDDGQTQSAIVLLVEVDAALDFQHAAIHEAARLALDALLAAQFPNGGFPQGWKGPVAKRPIQAASYPGDDWRTTERIKNYWDMYTINDNVCGYAADALIVAYRTYRDDKYKSALNRLGDFLALAQMPDPQPAWAQQYDYEMHPIWARKFEPPAISGSESQQVIETLIKIARVTDNRQHLRPIPRALEYLRRSCLPEGQLARYYELKTNRPLYMVRQGKQYTPSYSDAKLPGHYGWKFPARLDRLAAEHQAALAGQPVAAPLPFSAEQVADVLRALDEQGRWVSVYQGERLVGQPKFPLQAQYISSGQFSENLTLLSNYHSAHRP